jgi:hypothetical protein
MIELMDKLVDMWLLLDDNADNDYVNEIVKNVITIACKIRFKDILKQLFLSFIFTFFLLPLNTGVKNVMR